MLLEFDLMKSRAVCRNTGEKLELSRKRFSVKSKRSRYRETEITCLC